VGRPLAANLRSEAMLGEYMEDGGGCGGLVKTCGWERSRRGGVCEATVESLRRQANASSVCVVS
jgi:hypothetical protein